MRFQIKPADTHIWNLFDLVNFLGKNQGKNIVIVNGTEGCCAHAIGLYSLLDKFSFNSITVETSNVLESHPDYKIQYACPWKFLDVARSIEDRYHQWNKKYVFGTLYGRPLWHRIGIASYLLTHHADISKVGFVANPDHVDSRELFEISQLWCHDPDSVKRFCEIKNQLPLIHDNIDQYTPGEQITDGFVKQAQNVYMDFFVDIVAETFTSGNCFFITEKTVRPMLLKKPFVIFGSKNFLAYLRQMGFRTFADFWSEDYDGYQGRDRYVKILELIDHISTLSVKQLETMYWDMQYTLDHNHDLLMSRKFKKKIEQIR